MINIDEKFARTILDKGRYYAYMAASTVCYATCSLNIQKALRSKLPKSKLQYAGAAIAMSLAGNAASEKAERLGKALKEKAEEIKADSTESSMTEAETLEELEKQVNEELENQD